MLLLLALIGALSLPPPSLPINDSIVGQTGSCRTVFEGSRIESFAFKTLAVLMHFNGPHRHVVLIKLLGDRVNFTGVVAGMSGSPCFIGNQLVGAIAYKIADFAKEPIAGITPIQSMLDALKQPLDSDLQAWDKQARMLPLSVGGGSLQPLIQSIQISRMPAWVWQAYQPEFSKLGVQLSQGSGSGSAPMAASQARRLQPGAAVAARLIGGDMDASATGTVTWVDGNQVYAFGHPLFNLGAVDLPMNHADILYTMVGIDRSFKLSRTGVEIGAFRQDRLTSLAGYLQASAATLPVEGEFSTPLQQSRFHYQIARDRSLTPSLLALATTATFANRVEAAAQGTAMVEAELEFATNPVSVLKMVEVAASERDPSLLIQPARAMAQKIALLWHSAHGLPPPARMRMRARFQPQTLIEHVHALHLPGSYVRAGEPLQVTTLLRDGPHEKQYPVVTTLEVPNQWAGRSLRLLVASGSQLDRSLHRPVSHPPHFAHTLAYLNALRADNRLYVALLQHGEQAVVAGQLLQQLPPTAMSLLALHADVAIGHGWAVLWETSLKRPGLVLGEQSIDFTVAAP